MEWSTGELSSAAPRNQSADWLCSCGRLWLTPLRTAQCASAGDGPSSAVPTGALLCQLGNFLGGFQMFPPEMLSQRGSARWTQEQSRWWASPVSWGLRLSILMKEGMLIQCQWQYWLRKYMYLPQEYTLSRQHPQVHRTSTLQSASLKCMESLLWNGMLSHHFVDNVSHVYGLSTLQMVPHMYTEYSLCTQ